MNRATCACGKVQCEMSGEPIAVAVCYCDDCQRGSARLQALAPATPVLDADGGTAYVLYRKDRFQCVQGDAWLRVERLTQSSPTNRVLAGCCNSAMYLDFTKGHWISIYRGRLQGAPPPVQMRIQTRFKPEAHAAAGDVPTYRSYAPRLMGRLLMARLAMLWATRRTGRARPEA